MASEQVGIRNLLAGHQVNRQPGTNGQGPSGPNGGHWHGACHGASFLPPNCFLYCCLKEGIVEKEAALKETTYIVIPLPLNNYYQLIRFG